jgi:rhamnosyltransferase
MKSTALGFILYQPDEIVTASVDLALNSGYKVFVYDNSPDSVTMREYLRGKAGVSYFGEGINRGLGIGLTHICSQAFSEGYSSLLFFDQDTLFTPETLSTVEEFYQYNKSLMKKYAAVVFNSSTVIKDSNSTSIDMQYFKQVCLARNSGSLYYLPNLSKMSWHDTSYFVDGVDYEFCLRARLNKMLIGEYSQTPGFDHTTEQDVSPYKFPGTKMELRKYSWNRIKDTVRSSMKIIIKSIRHHQILFMFSMLRLIHIYVFGQIVIRLIYLFKPIRVINE